jgi:hypothetical protein
MSRDDELLPDAEPVSEQGARKVLERAIQIDAERAGDTTVGELRKIAQELNISPTALMQALREVHVVAPEQPQTPDAGPRKLSRFNRALGWVRTVGIGAIGLLTGVSLDPFGGDFAAAIAILSLGSIALTIYDRRSKPQKSSLIDITVLFLAFLWGWGRQPTNPIGTSEVSFWFIAIGGLVSLAASWLLSRVDLTWFKDSSKQNFTTSAS